MKIFFSLGTSFFSHSIFLSGLLIAVSQDHPPHQTQQGGYGGREETNFVPPTKRPNEKLGATKAKEKKENSKQKENCKQQWGLVSTGCSYFAVTHSTSVLIYTSIFESAFLLRYSLCAFSVQSWNIKFPCWHKHCILFTFCIFCFSFYNPSVGYCRGVWEPREDRIWETKILIPSRECWDSDLHCYFSQEVFQGHWVHLNWNFLLHNKSIGILYIFQVFCFLFSFQLLKKKAWSMFTLLFVGYNRVVIGWTHIYKPCAA